MKRFLATLPLYFFIIFIHSALSQNKNNTVLNAFSDRIFDGKGYQSVSNLKWKFKTEGKIFSSPIAKNDIVYIGSEDGFLYAVEEKSGSLKWKFKTNGAIHSSPSIFENTIYFGSFDGNYYAVNTQNGKLHWKFKTGGEHWLGEIGRWGMKPETQYMEDLWDFYLSSPVVYVNGKTSRVLFGSSDGNIYSLDAKTGALKWKFKTNEPVHGTPVIDKDKIYIGGWDATLYALNIESGKEIWHFATGTQMGFKGIQSSVAVSDGIVYFGAREPFFFALDAQTGKQIWKYNAENSWILSSAVIKDNTVYVGSSDTYALLALDAKTGAEKYRFKVNGYVYSSPATAGNTIYFGDFTGNFFSLDLLSNGKTSNVISTDNRKQFAASTLKNDLLDFGYAGQNEDLSLYDNNKKVMDKFYQLGSIVSSPFISNNTIYFGSADGYLYAYHLEK
ncbi:PQQ-binding-like beta-propeller repeat protein [Flavobacterium piscisymbiosum]|uniref:PQQ-binding-like beta-propeller repeat protein n=1 Tax=Flavobacterium piscisymbiosum TaxID=2893753 RepID=A0ABS8MJZ7_9FLAO|nr:PQQ-binding-like beta-propeller repeat protein [Flavobacterium sp. F-30]MCC9065830.1 PQQ-binding-like beta-propeller repeat protein [Flavobacterium sp. F-30]